MGDSLSHLDDLLVWDIIFILSTQWAHSGSRAGLSTPFYTLIQNHTLYNFL